jgi:transcriptional regulator with XRE-family HTH domain
MQSIAANVRRLRLRRGMTQDDLAEACELETGYVARIERAEINLSVGKLAQLADGLGVSPAQLLRAADMQEIRRGRPPKAR